ncbi:MAG: sterol desaturase family protein, partial [Ginsengibacter sp.]
MRFISLLYISLPLMAILILLEAWALAKEQTLNRKDLVASFLVALGRIPIAAFTNGFILALYITLYRYRIFDLSSNNWYTWILCFLCDDFSFYWFHRVSHKSRFLWASHQVHHSSNHFTLSAGIRVPWTSELTGNFLFWAWMPLLGIPPLMVIFAKSVSVVYQFWLHTEKILKMPFWFEAFFNTPSHHRVHHGSNLKYLDKNHGGTLIIWDKMFGTFQTETGRAKYGLRHRLKTANPLVIVFHEWHRLLKDVRRSPSWRQKFCYFFKAPGWSPEDNSKTTKKLLTAGIVGLQKGCLKINKTKTITNKISKMKKQLVAIFISSLLLSCLAVHAQTNTIAGVVRNSETNESISGASILVKGSPEGTYADEKGYFKIVTREKTPVTLIISSVGYQPAEVSSGESPELVVQMKPSSSLEVGVVVAATRAPLRILESPVSVEKFNYNNIINSPASSYYDIAGTLKGVDLTTSSLLFKTISTRGFNGSG